MHNILTNKLYADGNGPSYSYTPDGKLARRTWARGIATDYTYDNAGQLVSTTYSDNTPTITMSYDRVGNLINATTAGAREGLVCIPMRGFVKGVRLRRTPSLPPLHLVPIRILVDTVASDAC